MFDCNHNYIFDVSLPSLKIAISKDLSIIIPLHSYIGSIPI